MIRLPSAQRTYDMFVSIDPAFHQLERGERDDAAWTAARDEHMRKLTMARETGHWDELRMPGGSEPTKFQLRPVPGEMFRTLADWSAARKIGPSKFTELLVRCAIVGVSNLGDAKVEMGSFEGLGRIASSAITNLLDEISPDIVNELAGVILERQGLGPK